MYTKLDLLKFTLIVYKSINTETNLLYLKQQGSGTGDEAEQCSLVQQA